MKRLISRIHAPVCYKCGDDIGNIENRKWVSSLNDRKIIGICFMDEDGNTVEAFDLCDKCIGKLYAKMIF